MKKVLLALREWLFGPAPRYVYRSKATGRFVDEDFARDHAGAVTRIRVA